MDNKIKIIKLNSNKSLYKDILSSSEKVKEIIKKTKANRNRYKKKMDIYSKLEQEHEPEPEPEPEAEPIKQEKPKPIKKDEPKPIKKDEPKPVKKDEPKPIKEESTKTHVPKMFSQKTKVNKSKFFKYEKKNITKTHKNIPIPKKKSKKINESLFKKSNDILKYFNKKHKIKVFTNKQIDKFVNVLNYYSEYEDYKNINKYIKKLNKYQTIQILFRLKLISKKSKAPVSLLKSILYSFFYSTISIS